MDDLLFLSHRIPYPPNKGEKIRAWNILRHLALRYRVHLGFFIDVPDDVNHVKHLEEICASVFWRPLSPRVAKLRSLARLFSGTSLTEGYFSDGSFRRELERVVLKYQPGHSYVFSSAMAPYLMSLQIPRVIVDMVDVDSEKWRQYAERKRGVARYIYARESRTLLALECHAAEKADAVLFVSRAEAEVFRQLAPRAAARARHLRNGVDFDYFDPAATGSNPFGARASIVFTGAMDYWPNVEAVTWFVEYVMPQLRSHPAAPCFWIVGSNPNRAVLRIAGPDVRVTGHVADVRPYLGHARVVVAPLHIARGIQNKVLEAMSMAKPVVVTPQAREGLDSCRDDELLTAATPSAFVKAILGLLDGDDQSIGLRARARVVTDYGWQESLTALDQLIESEAIGACRKSDTLNLLLRPTA